MAKIKKIVDLNDPSMARWHLFFLLWTKVKSAKLRKYILLSENWPDVEEGQGLRVDLHPPAVHTPHTRDIFLSFYFRTLVVRGCSLFRCDHTHTHTPNCLSTASASVIFNLVSAWLTRIRRRREKAATALRLGEREWELAVVMCTLRLHLHSTAWWRSGVGRSAHLSTHCPG